MKFTGFNLEQKRTLIFTFILYVVAGSLFMIYCGMMLYNDRLHARDSWDDYLSDAPEQAAVAAGRAKNATQVTVGTYVENLREINLKSSFYRVEFEMWFMWEGDPGLDLANNFRVYKGIVNSKHILREFHEDGKNYQLVSVDASVSKRFVTRRFPLESHQLRFYVEANYPIEDVVFVADKENSGLNRNITLTGYDFARHNVGTVSFLYDTTHGYPGITDRIMSSEIVTAMEINRASYGLFFKCFIALAGTLLWALIALFICIYHHVDPLGMLPGALFGAVGNIMVGASLLPDALETGLLEYVNIWGILIIMGVTIAIININRLRKNQNEGKEFVHFYGRSMFYTVLTFTIIGMFLFPLISYSRM